MRTWHFEMGVVALVLGAVTVWRGSGAELIAATAVLRTNACSAVNDKWFRTAG